MAISGFTRTKGRSHTRSHTRSARLIGALALAAVPLIAGEAAWAGNADSANPNMGHFYMARQQIQITDDSPVINYKGGGAPGQAGAQGMAPGVPAPLPRAGFQRFSQTLPSYSNTLPQVNNGVPKAPPPVRQNLNSGMQGKAGKLKPSKKKAATTKKPAAAPKAAATPKAYSPYKGYDPKTAPPPSHTANAHAGGGSRTDAKVRGSVLHWARGRGGR
ncbi:MAG: hypothetical protein KC777_23220 [Cyanobacteria bacterium HKST-UBA02]|nr:hypothetical protein [Cyanobacteria bacterium HKST-UBA02]